MKMMLVTLRQAASFRNQADLIYKAAVKEGYEVDSLAIQDIVGPPKGRYDKLIALIPIWPRYIFEMTRLTAPWMSKTHVIYGPVDGPLQTNINLFNIMKNMRLVTPSYWCKEMLARNGVKVIAVIPHGIDHADFEFKDKTRYTRMARLRKEYPRKTILFSNLNPLHRKGFPQLVKALELLYKKMGTKFIFILHTGRKQALKLCPSLAKTPRLVIEDAYNKLPFRAIAEKTCACDIYVHPALLEGFGLPILEAMAAKRTIVCLDAAPMNELVGPKEAWLFPFTHIKEEKWRNGSIAQLHEYDPEDLATAMEAAILEKEQSKEKAAAAYTKSLDYDYRKVYKKLVKM